MPHITLAVTEPVRQQVVAGNDYQRQLAVQGASADVRAVIDAASAANQVQVAVAGMIVLTVGDTGAIWGVHQQPGLQADDFTSLFDLLVRRPGVPITFTW